jgi:hypothetical protein
MVISQNGTSWAFGGAKGISQQLSLTGANPQGPFSEWPTSRSELPLAIAHNRDRA